MTDKWKKDGKITLGQGVRFQWEEAQNCHVLLFPEGMIQLNPTASQILELCDGSNSYQEILNKMQKKYPKMPIKKDIKAFLEDVYGRGWITNK